MPRSPEERTKSLGWLSAVTSLGAVAGPAFGSVMISLGGRSAPGLAAAALSLLVAGLRRALPGRVAPAPDRRVPRRPLDHQPAPGDQPGPVHRHEPASRLIWIYTIGIGAFYGTIQVVPLLLMNRLGVTEQNIGYFVMYLGGMGVVVRSLLLGRAVDLLGEARLSRLGLVLLAAGLGCTGIASHGGLFFLGFTLMPLGTAFLFPCVTGLLSRAGALQRARALHGSPAHLRRRIAGAVPSCCGPPDGPVRGGGRRSGIAGTSGACHPAVRVGAGRIAGARIPGDGRGTGGVVRGCDGGVSGGEGGGGRLGGKGSEKSPPSRRPPP